MCEKLDKLIRLHQEECFDIISEDELEQKVAMTRKEIIEKHKEKYPIWLATDGRWKTRIPDDKNKYGKIIARKDEQSLNETIIEFYKNQETNEATTMATLYPKWIAYKELETTTSNAHKLAWAWNKYYEGDPITKQDIKKIKVIDAKTWFMNKIDECSLTRKQYKEVKSVMNGILDYAVETELISVNVSRAVRGISAKHFAVPEKKEDATKVYMVDEQGQLLKTCEECFEKTQDTAFLAIAMNLHLGLRVGELAALKPSDFSDLFVHIEREEVTEYVKKGERYVRSGRVVAPYTKTPESVRDVPITSNVRKYYKHVLEINARNAYNTEYLFFNKNTGDRMTADRINRVLQRVNKMIGTPQKGNHGLRRTYLSTLDAFGNLTDEEIRSVAGHREITTTQNSYLYSVKRPENRIVEFEKALGTANQTKNKNA